MKNIHLVISVAGAMMLSALAIPARAATQDQINQAITNGLTWLVSQQNTNGSWQGSSGYTPVAYTGYAVLKLEQRAFELGYASPFDDVYPYKTNVVNGLNYLFNQATTNGRAPGICFAPGDEDTETYGTGIAMMAIAASRAPTNIVNVSNSIVNGMTYKEVLQSIVNYFAASQNPDGGWRYYASNEPSDNSNTGFAVLGLRYAEAPIFGFDCVIPETLKAALSTNWINAIQVSGGANDGGSDYMAGSGWVNLLKTGNLLFEMSFVGDDTSIQRVQRAIAYIERNWNDSNEDPGWMPHNYLAMQCLMEGFGSLDTTTITVNGTNVDWFGQFTDAIVTNQQSNGSWPADSNTETYDAMLSTEWALLVLEKVSPVDPLQITPATGFDATGCVGGPFSTTNETFSLTNVGTAPLNWSLANTSAWLDASPSGGTLTVGGTTNVTVSLNSNAYSLTSGIYTATVWFTNLNDGVVQSRQFTLAVGLPTILSQPQSLTVFAGSPASFSVSVSGTPLYFQWQKNGTNLTDGGNISGSVTSNLLFSTTTTNDDGSYAVIITDACGSVTSSVATLTVLDTITWTNTSGGNWSVAANWSPNHVPGATIHAFITNSGTYTVTLDASVTVASLTLGGPSGTQSLVANANTLTLNGASTVGSNGSFNLGGGTLSGSGSLTVNGPFNWSSGTINNTGGVRLYGTSSLSGVGDGAMKLSGLLINAGTLTWGGSGNNLYNSGTLTNLASGTITISADVSTAYGSGTIGNAGLLRKTGTTGTTTLNVALVNSGDVQVQSGTLDLTGGGSASGTFEVSANATLQFDDNYTLGSPSSVTGAGTVLMSSGNLTVNTPVTMAVTNLILSGGILGGSGSVTVNGPFNWSSGTINNTGGVTLNGVSSLSGVGGDTMRLYGLLINAGTLTWGGSGNNLYNSGTLTNLASGTITISADVSTAYGSGTIGNAGLLRKTGTTGTTTLNVALVNSGDVQVQSGTLDLTGGGSASGTFEVSANATLQFDDNYTLGSPSSVTGAGTVLMSSGNLTVNTPVTMAVTNLILSGGILGGSGSVTVNGPFNWSSGTINNTGGVTLNGVSSLSGVGGDTMRLYGLLINAGTLTWGGSGNNLYNSGTLTNLASGTITISADVSTAYGSGTIGNAGLLRKTGTTGTTTLNVALVNSGDVQVQSGTLDLTGGGSASGTFEVSANATLQFDDNYTLSSPSSVTGAGTVLMSSGTVNLSGTFSLSGTNTISGGTLAVNSPGTMAVTNLILSGGILSGNAPVAVNGPFNWSSGTINNTGGVTLNGVSSLSGVGEDAMELYGLLINAGTLTWGGSGNNFDFNSGTLTNLASGTITISADVSTDNEGGGTIGNAGLLRKTGTTGTTTLNVALVNSGDVQVQSGTLDLTGGGSASGTFEVSANATLQFGNSYTLGSPSSVTGAGTVLMSSGNLTVNTPVTMAVTNLILSGGILGGSGSVTVNGPFNWSSGTINNTGGVTLNGVSSLSGVGGDTMRLYGLLINAGTLTWGGSGNNLYNSGTLTNLASGTITISADVSTAYGSGTIGNAGLLRKTGTTGTTTLNVAFVNTGTLDAQSGTISLTGGYTLTKGTLNFGISCATNFGKLSLGSSVVLGGPLNVNVAGNFAPAVGEQFQIVSSSGLSGTFSSTNVPAGISVTYSNNGVFLVVTGPVPVQIFSPQLVGTNFIFQFPTASGQSYTIQGNDDLTTTNWVFYTNIVGNGSTIQFRVPVTVTPPQRFFRIWEP